MPVQNIRLEIGIIDLAFRKYELLILIKALAPELLFGTEDEARIMIERCFKEIPEYIDFEISNLGQTDSKVAIITTLGKYLIDYNRPITVTWYDK